MTYTERALQLRPVIEKASQSLEDAVALTAVELFPKWAADTSYVTGERVQYENVLYRVLTDHTSQADWKPTDAPSLFARVLIPDPGVIPEWEQPESTNPYMTGDRVTHNGRVWVSDVDNNVWEPGAYGWSEVTDHDAA